MVIFTPLDLLHILVDNYDHNAVDHLKYKIYGPFFKSDIQLCTISLFPLDH